MHTAAEYFSALALAVLAGPLLAAGLSKLLTPADKTSWPIQSGRLRAPAGPRLVGAGELLVAALISVVAERAAAVLALAAYLALTAVAYSLRGQECACFGVARLAAVGRLHVAANAAGVVLAAAATATATSSAAPALRLGGAVVVGAATFGLVLLVDRTRGTGSHGDCAGPVAAVHLYVSSSCPSCRAIRQMLAGAEPARRAAVTITELQRGQRPPERFGRTAVPCAVGLSAEGEETCGPAFGLAPVWALIERIVIGLGVHAG